MEKHRCKLCYRRFSNGRALGGHMKSHMMHLPVPVHPKPESGPSFESLSSLSNSSDSTEPEEGEIVTLQDKGSDTESTKNNVTRRRSKRTRKPAHYLVLRNYDQDSDCNNNNKLGGDGVSYYCDDVEQQPGSSISEVTSEEDVAFCLMMMSRDKWVHNGPESEYEHGYGYGYEKDFSNIGGGGDGDDDDEIVPMSSHKKRYKCETCNKVFKSYQALGGHRASHKKTRGIVDKNDHKTDNDNRGKNHMVVVAKEEEKKIHECPICFRVFASGQALGGHKRSHVIVGNNGVNVNNNDIQSQTIAQSSKKKKVIAENLIDLNLPAPIDDEFDEEFVSQIATSAISNVHL